MSCNYFFGHYIDPLSLSGKTLVLLLAVILGGLIGLERQWRGNSAGLRTHILVCLGSTVITLASVEIGLGVRGGLRGDPGHIAAQIVSGIGFLGAGAILRDGLSVRGLTTAASVWTTAGIGIALGASPRLGEMGVVATLITLGILIPLSWVETRFRLKQVSRILIVEVLEKDHGPARVLEALVDCGLEVQGVQSQAANSSLTGNAMEVARQMHITVFTPSGFDTAKLTKVLTELTGVQGFHLE